MKALETVALTPVASGLHDWSHLTLSLQPPLGKQGKEPAPLTKGRKDHGLLSLVSLAQVFSEKH